MILPMAVLAVGAAFAGLAGSPAFHQAFFHLLGDTQGHEGIDVPILLWSSMALIVGVTLAFVVGVGRRNLLPAVLRPFGSRWYRVAADTYYVDEAYHRWIIRPFMALAEWLSQFDRRVIDGAVDGAGLAGWRLGQWKERFDRLVVDGMVNGLAAVTQSVGRAVRMAQTGVVHHYLFWVVTAAVCLMMWVRIASAH
jgi:NADH-quinone oxidoreductase subunit L